MLLIFIAIILAAAVGVFLACSDYILASLSGIFITVGSGLAAVTYAFAGWFWIASAYQTDIINREYGTNYTREEIFWASDVIDTVRELHRKRIELNGNLMQDSDKE